MSNIFLDSIAESLAELGTVSVAKVAVNESDFGTDLDCADDLTATMADLGASSPTNVAQSIYRRLITPRGALVDDPDYGFDLRTLLRTGLTRSRIAAAEGQVRNEVTKDDRVESVASTASYDERTATLHVSITGQTAKGPFTLVLASTDKETFLLELA